MSAIGDLFLRLLIDDKGFAVDLNKKAGKAGDQAGKTMGQRMTSGVKSAVGGMKGGILGGLGLGAGLGAIAVATAAIGKLTDVMGDAVAAALAEEKSIAKLDAALKANVEGYDGNTDAIEKTLKARMRLGFADDEQRESLALIVAATKDYDKALKVQRVAMDLSRLKGISLQAASEALIKVEAGQFRILKSLGIQLPKNATATEALAAVEKVATGQAEAYANTNEGKLLASQIRVGEALEKLGGRIMPLFVTGVEAGAEIVESFALALDALSGKFPETTQESVDFIETMLQFSPMKDLVSRSLDQVKADLAETGREANRGLAIVESSATDASGTIETLGDDTKEAARIIRRETNHMGESWKEYAARILGLARDEIQTAYQIIEDRAALAAANVEAAELRKVIATGKATDEQKLRYQELGEEQALLLIDLAANGVKSGKEVNTAVVQMRKRLKTASGQEKKAIQTLLDIIDKVGPAARAQYNSISQLIARVRPLGLKSGPQEFAEGGIRPPGVASWVGEKGPELSVPLTPYPSLIIPSDLSMAMVGGGSGNGGNTYNVSMLPPPRRQSLREVGGDLRSLGEMGYLPGSKR